jgi:hypothetical protein
MNQVIVWIGFPLSVFGVKTVMKIREGPTSAILQ